MQNASPSGAGIPGGGSNDPKREEAAAPLAAARPRRKTTLLRERLQQLKRNVSQVSSVLLATSDGLTLCALTRKGHEEARLSPLCASTVEICRRNGKTFDIGEFDYSIIKGAEGQIVILAVPPKYILGAHINKRGNLALVLEAMETARAELRAILDAKEGGGL